MFIASVTIEPIEFKISCNSSEIEVNLPFGSRILDVIKPVGGLHFIVIYDVPSLDDVSKNYKLGKNIKHSGDTYRFKIVHIIPGTAYELSDSAPWNYHGTFSVIDNNFTVAVFSTLM